MLTRRQLLSDLGAATVVVGFDPIARRWLRARADFTCAPASFSGVPRLDGTLTFDPAARAADSTDEGNIVQHVPAAVLAPGSVEDIRKMVRFCAAHGIRVATRGQHHSMHGQGLTCGLIIENRALSTIHSIGPDGADVDTGVTWKELLTAAFAQGLRPPGVTGYAGLSIGGTLSVGGCPLSNDGGALVDRVQVLTVVTGTGHVVNCSESADEQLFEAMLGGLGQCGVIARAKVDLVQALPLARTYFLSYADTASFFRDMRKLINRGELDEVYNVSPPPSSSTLFQINAVIFFDPSAPPNDDFLMRGLTVRPSAVVHLDRGYVEYATFVDSQIEFLRAVASWDSLIKPWYDVWLPDAAVESYVTDVIAHLTPEDVGPTGFVLIFAQRRRKLTRPFFRVPASGEWVWLFDLSTASALPGPDPDFIRRMLARNRRLFNAARALGGTRYPIGALDFNQSDWIQHYGPVWNRFARLKQRFDPNNILTPGPGIF